MTAAQACPHTYFIAGTDTGIGKTFVTALLLRTAHLSGLRALGMKPVAAGVDAHGRNEDVQALVAASNVPMTDAVRADVNPFLYQAAVSPHIAAREEGRPVDLAAIAAARQRLAAQADVLLVEGVGGWRAPLSDTLDSADLACALQRPPMPVVLVVGLRLGCLNHALLTAEAIAARGLRLAGWLGNHIDPAMQRQADNVRYLQTQLQQAYGAPCLGLVPHVAGEAERGGPALDALAQRLLPRLRLPWSPEGVKMLPDVGFL
ncbi:dethiobiotin synthase [Allofranklinella schreckenbergeri]|uniref:ATP-dependent dethiobiotin synthetase BioD n=1 Tax=Allofranklinella schreckenbergeri TaxID=1076744 RepID=A0A3M6Q8L7_9BURK|nr:dethiobiotin synthase [Allofranklinella schreckenbergeri]RMW98738.1 dethiobiotin synthase [Allofranklinella schreckenbergeri]